MKTQCRTKLEGREKEGKFGMNVCLVGERKR